MTSDRLPNLVLAGVTKCGTTSLASYLDQHPDVFVPPAKELNHFSPLVYGEPLPDLATLRRHFEKAGHARWRLDASPFYFVGGGAVAQAVARDLDEPHVVIAIREPVSRLWSSFRYKKSKGRLPRSLSFDGFFAECRRHFDQGTDLEPRNANFLTLRTGRYADFLQPWLQRFGPRLRLVFAEDLRANPTRTMSSLFEWLDVTPEPARSLDTVEHNVTSASRSVRLRQVATRLNAAARPVLARQPALRRGLVTVYSALNTSPEQERLSLEGRAAAEDFYAASVSELAALLAAHDVQDAPSWVASGG